MLKAEDQKQFVAYYRVSTSRQGQSGLGLEAQRESVARFIAQQGGELIQEFTEVETGKGKNALSKRPELAAAFETCKRHRAELVIAKLDRLARNVHFISGLMETGIEFVAVDSPTKDKFRLHLEAVFAEEEARRISLRTRESLAACKRRGVKLGTNGKVLAEKQKKEALEFAHSLSGTINQIRKDGHKNVCEISKELNRLGILSARGGKWFPQTTHRMLQRLEAV